MRAASTAWTVSGTGNAASALADYPAASPRTRTPLSMSSPTSSSRKNGLPLGTLHDEIAQLVGKHRRQLLVEDARGGFRGKGSSQMTVVLRFPVPHAGR